MREKGEKKRGASMLSILKSLEFQSVSVPASLATCIFNSDSHLHLHWGGLLGNVLLV